MSVLFFAFVSHAPSRNTVSWSVQQFVVRKITWARLRTTEFKCGRGTEDSAAKRGFGDHAVEMFYVDFVEPGNSQ